MGVGRIPWRGLLLIWNCVGACVALYGILAIGLEQPRITLPEPPDWFNPVFMCLWFLPMPFTTFVVTTGL